jgi:N-terminal acetyltransferase B complex catalytic subunit
VCKGDPIVATAHQAAERRPSPVPLRRKQGLARRLMWILEEVTEKVHDAYFVDLFVRVSNQVGGKVSL